jgi:hypothetical protein
MPPLLIRRLGLVWVLLAGPALAGSGLTAVSLDRPADWVSVHPFAKAPSYVAFGPKSEGFADGCGDVGACKLEAAPAPDRPAAVAAARPQSSAGCDPNYSGRCVPMTGRDVDCAGKGGNGPIFVQGPFRVVREDVYDLDADGDGIACEPLH